MPEALVTRGLRGATTVDEDTPEQIATRIQELLTELMARNDLVEDDIISIIFTATTDVVSAFPATGARDIGFGAVPLLCMSEINVASGTPLCMRVLLHIHTTRSRAELRHVYLHGAQGLRDDLPV
ncbi:MAG TPA: chorismate mutase [Acidimicrobiales bacterium]|nr:chorismate mutase [Acidimicrobiales bacterium]